MWGCLSFAGLLLAGCAFDPRGSSSSDQDADAGGGFSNPPADAAGPALFDAAGALDAPPPIAPVLLETLTIDVTRDPGEDEPYRSSVVLLVGRTYRLVAAGVVEIRDDGWSGDADYYWADIAPGATGDSAGGVDIGLAVNDFDGDANRSPDWGGFDGSHVYETTMAGNDSVLSAIFFDPNYDNNSGSLTLEIWGPPP